MRYYFFLFTGLCVLFISCDPQGNPSKINGAVPPVINDTITIEREYEGLYSLPSSGSFGTFNLCQTKNQPESYRLEDETKSLDTLYRRIISNPYPNQTIYIKVIGKIKSNEFPTAPLVLVVKKVLKVEQKNYLYNCIPYDFWCVGTEPFWQIQISEKENLIDFYDPMIPKFYHFNYSKAIVRENKIIYTSINKEKNSTIKIIITKEQCSDGMSERKFAYSTEVILNDKTLKGCAINKLEE